MTTKKQESIQGWLGIFWYWNQKLLCVKQSASMADSTNGMIDSHLTHVKEWASFQEKHSELRLVEYEEIPRGRIIYEIKTKIFWVFMDKTLFSARFKNKLIETFQLPSARVQFSRDPHYTIDPTDLEGLFGENATRCQISSRFDEGKGHAEPNIGQSHPRYHDS